MSRYRRARVPGATYFFTVNLLNRRSDLLVRQIDLLCETVRGTRSRHPFHIDAWVVLPDHMHCVWTYQTATLTSRCAGKSSSSLSPGAFPRPKC